VLYTASVQDEIELAAAEGREDEAARRLNDLLLPVVKGFGSERSYALLAESLQTLGGSGYLQDYPIEQYLRDAKIDTLYEGTTAIQGLDLFFRKIVRDRGAALTGLLTEIASFAASDAGNGRLKAERRVLEAARADVAGMVTAMHAQLRSAAPEVGGDPRNVYRVGLNTTRLLESLGDLIVGWLLLRQAEVALAALDAEAHGREAAFYTGKVAVASFFTTTVLPELAARRVVAETTDLSVMDLDEAAF